MTKVFKVGQMWTTVGAGNARITHISADCITVDTRHLTVCLNVNGETSESQLNRYNLVSLYLDIEPVPSTPPPPIQSMLPPLMTLTAAKPTSVEPTGKITAPSDLTLRELQTSLPWSIRYSTDFRSSPVSHKDFAHALHHVSKAAGKLHGLADDMDHDRSVADTADLRAQYGKYIADLVVCALRMANTSPGGVVDLQKAVQARIEDKNDVKL